MCMCAQVCMVYSYANKCCGFTCVEVRGQHQDVFLNHLPPYFWVYQTQWVPEICLFLPPPPNTRAADTQNRARLLVWVLRIKLRASCWPRGHCAQWAVFPVQAQILPFLYCCFFLVLFFLLYGPLPGLFLLSSNLGVFHLFYTLRTSCKSSSRGSNSPWPLWTPHSHICTHTQTHRLHT